MTLFKPMWSLKIHDRYKLMIWKLLSNILPTRSRLSEIIPYQKKEECIFCNHEKETLMHLFVECPINRILWQQSSWPLNLANLPIDSILDVLMPRFGFYDCM